MRLLFSKEISKFSIFSSESQSCLLQQSLGESHFYLSYKQSLLRSYHLPARSYNNNK